MKIGTLKDLESCRLTFPLMDDEIETQDTVPF